MNKRFKFQPFLIFPSTKIKKTNLNFFSTWKHRLISFFHTDRFYPFFIAFWKYGIREI